MRPEPVDPAHPAHPAHPEAVRLAGAAAVQADAQADAQAGVIPEATRGRELRRMQWLATGLLVAMALLLLAVRLALPQAGSWSGALAALGAFAEAAMVGALADWFAVTALFRRPFGLPIPHTDVIAVNKDRIGRNLGSFLAHNFMTREVIGAELARLDLAGAAARWLARPDHGHALAAGLLRALPNLWTALGRRVDLTAALPGWIGRLAGQGGLGRVLAGVGDQLVEQGRHQWLYDWLVVRAEQLLITHQDSLRERVGQASPRWLRGMADGVIAERVLAGLQQVLVDAMQPDSAWRAGFERWVVGRLETLRSSPEAEALLRGWLAGVLADPRCARALGTLQERVGAALADAAVDPARGAARLALMFGATAEALERDPELRQQLDGWLRGLLLEALPAQGPLLAAVVGRVVARWDGPTVARKLELQVGRDLQYIRINGTLVGGAVGLALHFLERLL